MSGTSLDGIDLALCEIDENNSNYTYQILKAQTIEYSNHIIEQLNNAHKLNALDFIVLHKEYGRFLGTQINEFLQNSEKPEIIASHGHTIFHEPDRNLTFQLGDGAFIAAETGITCISDFRNLDTALGGQGAPLVPFGDKHLFPQYKYCLNLGGFSNISFDNHENQRIAFDISPVNFALNHFARKLGQAYDTDGEMGKSGEINLTLLQQLNNLEYYKLNPPKSLAREFFENSFLPVINKHKLSEINILRTLYEHIAMQIANVVDNNSQNKILITGGGAKNSFLTEIIRSKINNQIVIPGTHIVDFKEAVIFAFLAFCRIKNKKNILKSVTGSKHDNYGGVINLI